MTKQAPQEHKIKNHGWTMEIFPNLHISKQAFNHLNRKTGSGCTTSEEFFQMVKDMTKDEIIGEKNGRAGSRGVTPKSAKEIIVWKQAYRTACERYNEHGRALKEAEGHKRNYQNATKGLRDEIAISLLPTLVGNDGFIIDPELCAQRAYKLADAMIDQRNK